MNVFEAAAEAYRKGIAVAMATIIEASGSTPRSSGARMLVYADKKIVGSVGGGELERKVIDLAVTAIQENKHMRYSSQLDVEKGMRCAGKVEIYIEPLLVQTQLFLFGAGHVAHALVAVLERLNYGVTVIDDRPALLNEQKFPSVQRFVCDPLEFAQNIKTSPDAHFVLMTHLHERDQQLASILINKPHSWMGILGSARKSKLILKSLLEMGVSTSTIQNIQSPIGLDIGAQNPEEIAISIAAQLIAHRSNRVMPIQPKSDEVKDWINTTDTCEK